MDDFEDDSRYFEIMLPSRSTLGKGKKLVLTNKLGPQLGNYMIACVDADYDYLLQGATPTSRLINKNPFVFHTYAYAIENYQCYAATLHRVCVMATLNDRQIVEFHAGVFPNHLAVVRMVGLGIPAEPLPGVYFDGVWQSCEFQ